MNRATQPMKAGDWVSQYWTIWPKPVVGNRTMWHNLLLSNGSNSTLLIVVSLLNISCFSVFCNPYIRLIRIFVKYFLVFCLSLSRFSSFSVFWSLCFYLTLTIDTPWHWQDWLHVYLSFYIFSLCLFVCPLSAPLTSRWQDGRPGRRVGSPHLLLLLLLPRLLLLLLLLCLRVHPR